MNYSPAVLQPIYDKTFPQTQYYVHTHLKWEHCHNKQKIILIFQYLNAVKMSHFI